MISYRKIPFLTFEVSPKRKLKINLSGCNFNCKGCFAIAKKEVGREFSVKELIDLIIKSCCFICGGMVDNIQFTGGEPTVRIDYLLSLIYKLKELGVNKIGISTNGYLLNKNLVNELKSLDINYIKLDIKAYTQRIHRWYTGKTNENILKAVKLLHNYGLNFYVRTIFTPDIIDTEEIEKIASYLSSIDKKISYKIYQFAPEQLANLDTSIFKSPTREEMLNVFYVAKEYLNNVQVYTTQTAYKPDPYKCVEIRADELLDRFKKIDEISKSVIKEWNIEYFTMNQILKEQK